MYKTYVFMLQLTDSTIAQLSASLSTVQNLDLKGCKQVGLYLQLIVTFLHFIALYVHVVDILGIYHRV